MTCPRSSVTLVVVLRLGYLVSFLLLHLLDPAACPLGSLARKFVFFVVRFSFSGS